MAPVVTLHAVCTWVLTACLLAPLGCSRGSAPAAATSTIDDLRFRIAGNPADRSARLALARLELQAGRPGAAVRHYLVLADREALPGSDRRALAQRLVARAAARASLGDGDAGTDLGRARELDASVDVPSDVARAVAEVGALASLRANRPERARGQLALLPAHDARRAALDPQGSPVDRLGPAASWVWDGGARRAGLALLEVYWQRGGDEPAVLRRFAAARTWWRGADGLDYVARKRLVAAGVSLCFVAFRPDEFGCHGQLADVAADPTLARAVGRRARALRWRDSDPAWVGIALTSWLRGDASGWLSEVAERVSSPSPSGRAGAATLLLLGGQTSRARARVRELAGARGSPSERTVLVAEAVLVDETTSVDTLLDGDTQADGWVIALRGADASGAAGRLRALLARAPPAARRQYLRDRGWFEAAGEDAARAARWRRITSALGHDDAARRLATRLGLAPAPAAGVPLGSVFIADDAELAAVARAYERDPALADRLAAEYADGAVALGQRGPALAILFARLGDPGRSLEWWSAIARSSPNHPDYQRHLVEASAAVGDPTRALVHATMAAAGSGDAGAVFAEATRVLLRHDAPTEAMQAARSASSLVPDAERSDVLGMVAVAADRLGRADEAAAARRDRARILQHDDVVPVPAGAPSIALEGRWAPEDPDALVAAAAWNPHDLDVRRRLLQALSPEDPRFGDCLIALVGMGLDERFPTRQRAAFELLAEALDRAGQTDAARLARREARAVR